MPGALPALPCLIASITSTSLMSASRQSVTSRLETSRYRDFSQFFGLGLENFGFKKKSRYRSRKYLVSKKSRYRSLMKFLVSSLSGEDGEDGEDGVDGEDGEDSDNSDGVVDTYFDHDNRLTIAKLLDETEKNLIRMQI